ncbi:MAG: tetratricopeptide repeat protein [Spirochaetes bacterium]|jgi:tetratricopeptide (TPR) repeat protein|nr:tetratricopeptide repeat protein [Spirochaetota bacterium]
MNKKFFSLIILAASATIFLTSCSVEKVDKGVKKIDGIGRVYEDYKEDAIDSAVCFVFRFADCYARRGWYALYQARAYDEAIEEFNTAIKKDPADSSSYYHRGTAYRLKGDYSRAVSDFTSAIKLSPGYANAYNDRAIAYYQLKDSDNAVADAEKACKLKTCKMRDFLIAEGVIQPTIKKNKYGKRR